MHPIAPLVGPLTLLNQSIERYRQMFDKIVGIFAIPFVAWVLVQVLSLTPLGALLRPLWLLLALLTSLVSQLAFFVLVTKPLDSSPSEAWARTPALILPFIWILILSALITVGGFALFIIPGIIFSIWLSQSMYIMIAEEKRGLTALVTSWERVSGHWWSVLWRMIVVGFVTILVSLFVSLVVTSFGHSFLPSFVLSFFQFFVLTPIVGIYSYLLYADLRRLKSEVDVTAPAFTTKRHWLIGLAIVGLVLPIVIVAGFGIGLLILLRSTAITHLPAGVDFISSFKNLR
jgi:hypothetical protein